MIYLEKYLDRERSSKRNLMFHRISGSRYSQNDCESSVRTLKSNLDFRIYNSSTVNGVTFPSFSLFKMNKIQTEQNSFYLQSQFNNSQLFVHHGYFTFKITFRFPRFKFASSNVLDLLHLLNSSKLSITLEFKIYYE